MKKHLKACLCLFAAALLLYAALCPAGGAPRAAGAAVLPAPQVSQLEAETGDADVSYRFSLSAPDAVTYENYRRETYATVAKDYTDEQIAHSDVSWLLYPVVLLCTAAPAGGKAYPVKAFPADETNAALSLTADILPALVSGGGYTPEAFLFSLSVVAAADINGVYTELSDAAAVGNGVCPATVHIDYVLPAGADNGDNPAFLFAPLSEPLLLAYPMLRGNTFTGWQTESGLFVDSVPAGTRETRLYARFTPRVYKINYVMNTLPGYAFNRVSNSHNPKTHTYGEETPLYNVNAPSGYGFGGWYLTEDFSGEEITAIGADVIGDVLLYARWLSADDALEEDLRKAGWGDLDNDGGVTASDARLALRSAVGLEELSPTLIARADFAGLGRLTSTNARLLLRIAVGLDTLSDVLKEHGLL